MLTGNKGEWSEIYALLKIISDGQLYRGDGHLNKLVDAVLPIIKVLRDESDGTYGYSRDQNLVIVSAISGAEFKIPLLEFKQHAEYLLEQIRAAESATFSVPQIEAFIASFNCKSLKASSSIKSDIRVILHDTVMGTTPQLGFSIKSQLGSASTLLNAGRTTNFIYELQGEPLSDDLVRQVNGIEGGSKIKDRITKIIESGASLAFSHTENAIFSNNLTLIDSALPRILADLVYVFYSSTHSKLIDLVADIAARNPLNFDGSQSHPFYAYKIKRLLTDIALGMMPSRVWTGELDATGGYLVVKSDGEVLAYHIYNRNDFEDYLINNTKFETASSSRHDFGIVYEQEEKQYFKLNLQIRFLK